MPLAILQSRSDDARLLHLRVGIRSHRHTVLCDGALVLGLVLTQDGIHPGVDLTAVAEALPDEVEDRPLSHLVDARNLRAPHDLASREPDGSDELDHEHRSQGQRSARSRGPRFERAHTQPAPRCTAFQPT